MNQESQLGRGRRQDLTSVHISPPNRSLTKQEDVDLVALLQEYIDMFAWSLKELKVIHSSVMTHNISMNYPNATPVKQ